MRVMLTGATGMIGRQVLERLLRRGDDVRVLALPETVEQLPRHRGVNVVAGSLDDQALLDKAARGVSIVYHLGGLVPGSPPEELMRVNVQGTNNLLRASAAARVGRFVLTSSTAVYARSGRAPRQNIDETHPLRPDGDGYLKHYALSKIEAENLVHCYNHKFDLCYTILRAPGVYAPEARWIRRLLPSLLGRPWKAASPIAQLALNWVHVRDISGAIVLAGTHPRGENRTFNIAGGEAFSLGDLSAGVWKRLTRRASAAPAPPPRQRGRTLWYDFGKAHERLGYTPRVSAAEGFAEIAASLSTS